MVNIDDFSDVEIVAKTAYGENRGGGVDGMTSVINIVMNRATKPGWWGTTPREVCLKPDQFSSWNEDDPNYQIILNVTEDNVVYFKALDIANQALSGILVDITNKATYYIAKSIEQWPKWALGHEPCADIAGQLFFNDIV